MADHIKPPTAKPMSIVIPFTKRGALPIMFACTGSSDLAQVSNDIAITLDKLGYVEMLSIAGVGGNIDSVINKAKSRRPVYVIDGCDTDCAKRCLELRGIPIDKHIALNQLDVSRRFKHRVSIAEGARYLNLVYKELGITPNHRQEFK